VLVLTISQSSRKPVGCVQGMDILPGCDVMNARMCGGIALKYLKKCFLLILIMFKNGKSDDNQQ
jgi:hypothetical protein